MTGLARALEVVQGPPGTGKTRTIADILTCKLLPGHSAVCTSTSRQALDNLCEAAHNSRWAML